LGKSAVARNVNIKADELCWTANRQAAGAFGTLMMGWSVVALAHIEGRKRMSNPISTNVQQRGMVIKA
jgi:hypothetical protein